MAAAGRVRDAVDARTGDRPRPGDLYLLEATADFPVHWLLLDESPGSPEAFRAAPADTHPLLGPHDLLVESPRGPLRLRLDAAVDLPRAALRPELRLGALAAPELARARRERAAAADRQPPPPELAGWLDEVIHPAQILAAAIGPTPRRELPPSPRPPNPRRGRRRTWLFALAAGLLGLLAAGWLGWRAQPSRQVGRGLAERQAAEHTLLAERSARARERALAQAALQGHAASERRLQARIAELEAAPKAHPPLLNLPVAILYPARLLRGEEREVVHWSPAAPYLTVVLKLAESETWPRYGVAIRAAGKAQILWRSDALTLSDQGALQLALSRPLLPPGSYQISVQGLRDGRTRELAEYALEIARFKPR